MENYKWPTRLSQSGPKNTANGHAKALRLGIITSTFPFGHAERFLGPELRAISRFGHKVTIFPSAAKSNKIDQPELNADVVRLSVLAPDTIARSFRGLRRYFRGAIRSLLVLILSKTRFKTKLKNLALFPTALAVADEVCERRITHIHAYWLSGVSTVAFIASQLTGVEWSFTAHSWDIFLENNLIKEKVGSAKFGRVISESGRRGLVQLAGETMGKRLQVIRLGVVVPDHAAVIKRGESDEFRLLCPALFYYFKDHMSLLKALGQVADAGLHYHCVLAGDGPLRGSIARKIRDLHLEGMLSMPGMLPHDTFLKQLRSGTYDAVVLASRELEGIPVSLIEAMAAGVPCIATRTGAIPELINEECGILVREQDPQALAGAIMALASNREFRQRLAERARQVVAESFNAELTALKLVELMTHQQM